MPLRSPGSKDVTATSGGLRKLLETAEQESQEAIMGGGEGEEKLGVYDPRFLLPVLMNMLMMEEAGGVDVVQAIEKGCVGYAIMALAHADAVVNQMAVLYLGAVVSKLQVCFSLFPFPFTLLCPNYPLPASTTTIAV